MRTRSTGIPNRVMTLLLVAGIGVLAPGVNQVPAWAEQNVAPPTQGGFYATPPEVKLSQLPQDGGKPLKKYKVTKGCVQRSLDANVDIKNRPWGQQYLQIDDVQKIVRAATGSVGGGIKVAVIDTGVTQHPYFQGRVQSGGDYVLQPTSVAPGLEDCDGHGTEVAGIIAANPPADTGFRGVAPDATIVSIRQSSQNYAEDTSTTSQGSGSTGGQSVQGQSVQGPTVPGATIPGQHGDGRQQEEANGAGDLKSLAQAVIHATNTPGVKVINMSVDNCRPANGQITQGEQQLQAAVRNAVDKDVVVVAAAGNTSSTCSQNDQPNPKLPRNIVTPPWFSKDVISVDASDDTGGVAPFSVNGPWVSVAAPGTKITSLDPAVGSNKLANQTIEGNAAPSEIQGTSFAAPYVAGLVALVRAKYPTLSARQVMTRILSTAQHPAAPGGRDNFVGYGVVDAMAAVTASMTGEGALPSVRAVQLPSELPPVATKNWEPMVVALAGAGGGMIALLVTLFVVHTVRRNRSGAPAPHQPR
jgi:membrane-anchored mycosin MYCP